MRLPRHLGAFALLALAACGGSLVDHRNEGARRETQPVTCPGPDQLVCGNTCITQGVGPDKVCGTGCGPCLEPGPAHSARACNPTPDGQDRFCDWDCDPGYLKTASGCSAPALVAAGGQFSCATAADTGEVHCWGANDAGQLGPGVSGVARAISGKVGAPALAAVTALTAGPAHACAAAGGSVVCWGDATGWAGAAGGATPVEVTALAGATSLAAGAGHTCGITGGALACAGALLDGGGAPALGGTVLEVSAGDGFSCALVDDGSPSRAVKCWGANDAGQLGTGSSGPAQGTPVAVPFPPGTPTGLVLTHVAAGARHACAATDQQTAVDAAVFCWGDDTSHQLGANGSGTIGGPTRSRINKPLSTTAPTVLDAGGVTTCAVKVDGANALQCWGGDAIAAGGALAPGTLVDLTTLDPPGAFSVGGGHACIVDPAGRLAAWGRGTQGQLGDGAAADSAAPVLVIDR